MTLPLVAAPLRNNGKFMDCTMGPVNVYSCPSGGTLSGSTCNTTVTQAASVSGYSCASGTLSGSSCITTSSQAATTNYSCAAGQTLSGTTCNGSTTNSTGGTPVYGCASGYTLSGTICTTQTSNSAAATPGYSCPSGVTLSGNMCTGALWRTRYEPYGNTAAGVVLTDLGFTGHVNDAVSGLVYMQQRYYDPIAGRFLSVDPVTTDAKTGGFFNRYVYGNNNPYKYKDPDGRAFETAWDIASLVLSVNEFRNNPSIGNAIGVAVDAAAVVIPGIPGGVGAIRSATSTANKAADAVKGTAGGEHAGKAMTPAGKAEVKTENAAQHGGQTTCSNCGQDTVPAKQSQSGVTPPGNETHVDHVIPKSKGGDGSPSNGQVLCRDCNLKKSDN